MTQALPWISLIAGAALLAIITRVAVPPLTWFSLLFLLHASRSVTTTSGAACFWVAVYVATAIGWRGNMPISGPLYLGTTAVIATVTTLPFLVDRIAFQRTGFTAVVLFPMAFVAMELVRSRLGSSWGSIAYTQYGALPLMQLTAFVGICGITFVIAWFASAGELAFRNGVAWSTGGKAMAVFAAVAAIVWSAGAIRLALAPTDRPSMRVATINRPLDLFAPGEMTRIAEGRVSPAERASFGDKLVRLHDAFLDGTRREARAGARLVVWPEQNLLVFKDDEAAFLERATQVAASERIYIAIGMGTVHLGEPLPFENKLVLVDPDGHIEMSYRKEHPVMGWEAGIMRVGTGGIQVRATRAGRIGGAICFDADFPEFIRQAGRGGTDIFVLPTNEWRGIKDLHLQMHVFRAIENGMPVVRAAAVGLSAAIDPWGRVLAVSDHFAPGDTTLVAQLPVGHIPTLYSRVGDLFAWLCVAGVVTMLAHFCTRLV